MLKVSFSHLPCLGSAVTHRRHSLGSCPWTAHSVVFPLCLSVQQAIELQASRRPHPVCQCISTERLSGRGPWEAPSVPVCVGGEGTRTACGLRVSFFCPYFLGPGQVHFAFLSVLEILIWFDLQVCVRKCSVYHVRYY